MANDLATRLEQEIQHINRELDRKKEEFQIVCKALSADFGQEGGPSWESSSYETRWRVLNAEITTLTRVRHHLISCLQGDPKKA